MTPKSEPGIIDRGFQPAIDYFLPKVNLPTRTWRDLWQGQHAQAFVVAGAMKAELLEDLRGAVQDAVVKGESYDTFKRRFIEITERHGWAYRGGAGWRSRVIWQTNVRVAHSVGRYKQMIDPAVVAHMPYWMYNHTTLLNPREQHKALENRVYRYDDAFWSWGYPPNGWGCNCRVRPLSARQLRKLGKTGPDTAPATPDALNIPPEWQYNPGQTAWGRPHVDAALRKAGEAKLSAVAGQPYQQWARPDDLPIDKPVAAPLAQADQLRAAWQVTHGEQALLRDARGEELLVSQVAAERAISAGSNDAALLPLLREVVEQPVEVWMNWAVDTNGRYVMRKVYLKRIALPDGLSVILVAEALGAVWVALSGVEDAQDFRQGLLLWSRP